MPAGRTAGINPAARYTHSTAGINPAARYTHSTAGINPAARYTHRRTALSMLEDKVGEDGTASDNQAEFFVHS